MSSNTPNNPAAKTARLMMSEGIQKLRTIASRKRFYFYTKLPFQDKWQHMNAALNTLGNTSTGNQLQVYYDTGDAYRAMWQAIEEARHTVLWQTYICKDDDIGRLTIQKMVNAKKRGVEVQLLYDSGGNLTGRERLTQPLKDVGADVICYHPFWPFMWKYFSRGMQWLQSPAIRNHRKILVVDNEIAFAGGLNIGNDYASKEVGGDGRFRDTHCMVKGPAVQHLLRVYKDTLDSGGHRMLINHQHQRAVEEEEIKKKQQESISPSPSVGRAQAKGGERNKKKKGSGTVVEHHRRVSSRLAMWRRQLRTTSTTPTSAEGHGRDHHVHLKPRKSAQQQLAAKAMRWRHWARTVLRFRGCFIASRGRRGIRGVQEHFIPSSSAIGNGHHGQAEARSPSDILSPTSSPSKDPNASPVRMKNVLAQKIMRKLIAQKREEFLLMKLRGAKHKEKILQNTMLMLQQKKGRFLRRWVAEHHHEQQQPENDKAASGVDNNDDPKIKSIEEKGGHDDQATSMKDENKKGKSDENGTTTEKSKVSIAQQVEEEDEKLTSRTMLVNDLPIQILSCNPYTRDWTIQLALWLVVRKAHSRVWVTTPYFLPHRKLTNAVISVANRGVDVRVIVGSYATSDPWWMWYVAQYLTHRLLRAGVRVYEFEGGCIMHAKTVVIDSVWSSVGSYNWDVLSNKLLELCVTSYSEKQAQVMEAHFRRDLARSKEITEDAFVRRPLHRRFFCWLAYHCLKATERFSFWNYKDPDLTSRLD